MPWQPLAFYQSCFLQDSTIDSSLLTHLRSMFSQQEKTNTMQLIETSRIVTENAYTQTTSCALCTWIGLLACLFLFSSFHKASSVFSPYSCATVLPCQSCVSNTRRALIVIHTVYLLYIHSLLHVVLPFILVQGSTWINDWSIHKHTAQLYCRNVVKALI